MRIGLNLLQARSAIGGGWQYIASLIRALQDFDRDNEYVAYCNSESQSLVSSRENCQVFVAKGFGSNQIGRIIYENSWLQFRAFRDRIDVMHWFGNTQSLVSATPAVVTVHDLIPFENPRAYDRFRLAYARAAVPRSVSRAAIVLPVSKATANELTHRFKVRESRIFVVPYPLEDCWRRANRRSIASFMRKHALPDRFWLYVAHGYHHKNHRNLFAAYALLRNRDPDTWPLVLRGEDKPGGPNLDRLVAGYEIGDSVLRLPALDRSEMPTLYSAATALVYPSKAEGQGLPLMEAIACGCPAVASDIPTTRELGHSRVALFNPDDPNSIQSAMISFQRDPGMMLTQSESESYAEPFRPAHIASTLLTAYRVAANS